MDTDSVASVLFKAQKTEWSESGCGEYNERVELPRKAQKTYLNMVHVRSVSFVRLYSFFSQAVCISIFISFMVID
jgi:hypothetical protein